MTVPRIMTLNLTAGTGSFELGLTFEGYADGFVAMRREPFTNREGTPFTFDLTAEESAILRAFSTILEARIERTRTIDDHGSWISR